MEPTDLVDVFGVISFVGLLIMGLRCVRPTVHLWRAEPVRIDNYRPASPVGKAMFHGFRRSMPLVVVLGIPVLFAALVLIVAGGASTPVGSIVRGVFLSLGFVYLVLLATIFLFNRPRPLIPPHLRAEPGMMRELRR